MRNTVIKSLQKAINRYLALDPEFPERAAVLHNQAVTIELLGVGWVFQMLFTGKGIELKTQDFSPPACTIKGTPLRLLHIMASRDNRQRFFSEDAVIEGNAEVGQQVMELFDQIEIDWEEHLSAWIGDVPAHHIGRFARGMKSWVTRTSRTLLQNVNEYTHEEIEMFPPTEAIQDFFVDVDTLRMDTDRLEARIARIKDVLAKRG